jgi:hypothetical protein
MVHKKKAQKRTAPEEIFLLAIVPENMINKSIVENNREDLNG